MHRNERGDGHEQPHQGEHGDAAADPNAAVSAEVKELATMRRAATQGASPSGRKVATSSTLE